MIQSNFEKALIYVNKAKVNTQTGVIHIQTDIIKIKLAKAVKRLKFM